MSGWSAATAHSLYGILFGLMLVAMGVLQMLKPELEQLGGDKGGPRASDFKLRHGDGGEDLRKVPVSPRWMGYTLIGLGMFHIAIPRSGGGPSSLFLIVIGCSLLAAVLFTLLASPWLAARRLRRYEAELARLAAASDTYSDELRALHANPPLVFSRRRQLLHNLVIAFFGAAFLALGLTIPR